MIEIQFITSEDCVDCERAKRIFAELKPTYPQMHIEEIDVTTPRGMELIQKYGIMASPGIVINGELFSTGALDKDAFVKKLDSLLAL